MNLNDEAKEKYYLAYKLGLINYDLVSCVSLSEYEDPNGLQLRLYCTKQFYIHINEAIKYLKKNQELYEQYLNKEFLESNTYLSLKKEMDYDNKDSYSNLFIKKYRDSSVHYTEDNKLEFFKYASELSNYFPDIEKEFPPPFSNEIKSIMLHLNMLIIENGITVEQYSEKFIDMANLLITVIDNIIGNLSNELE
jgi:hypothetical protein